MPAKTDRFWTDKVFSIWEEHPDWGTGRTTDYVEAEAARLERDDPPSERTVRRLRAEHKRLTDAQRARYRLFHWPASMQREEVPWELSTVGLELTRMFRTGGFGRPTVRVVRWTGRVLQAAPNCPLLYAVMVAAFLSTLDNLRDLVPEDVFHGADDIVERYLVDAPWLSGADRSTWSDLWSSLLKLTWLEGRLTPDQAATLWTMWFEEAVPVYSLVNAHIQAQFGANIAQVLQRGRQEGLIPERAVAAISRGLEELENAGKQQTQEEGSNEQAR